MARAKVEGDIFLALLVPVLILISKFIPKIALWVSKRFFPASPKEAEQMKTAIELKKEMNSVSMVDEFAKYAKIQRRLNQITLDLESSAGCRQLLQERLYKWVLGGLCVIMGIIYLSLLGFVGTSKPVFVVPKHWFAPLHTLFAYPTGIEGAISIPIWTVLTRNALSYWVKA